MANLTFRDFAGAVMQNDVPAAANVLQTLLGIPADQALTATQYFASRASDQAFMMKAMSLRAAVSTGTDDDIASLLGECFGMPEDARGAAVAGLRKHYAKP